MKFKQWIVQLLGVITTALSLLLIYLILFKDGRIQDISRAMLIEFFVVVSLCLSTKFFWYTSTESTIRNSQDYLEKRKAVVDLIGEEISDAHDFDTFIDVANMTNYNTYVSDRCKNITVANYKLSVFDWIHWLFTRNDKVFYLKRYILRVERQATKQHKLSGANIRALTTSTSGLVDDRNKAERQKVQFLTTSTVLSIVLMFATSMIAFTDKQDFDQMAAILKMLVYTTSIVFSILQSVLKARLTVATEDVAYFNRVISIIEGYIAYKDHRYTVNKVSYIEEIENGVDNQSSQA